MKPKTSPLIEQRAKESDPPSSRRASQVRRRRRTRVVLNVRLLIISAVILVAAIPSVVLWHSFQLRRNRDVFLARANEAEQKARQSADEAERKEHWGAAARHLSRYLQLEPGEEQTQEAHARLAIATDESADLFTSAKARAADLYVNAIRLSEDPAELKSRLGTLLLQWPGIRVSPEGQPSEGYDYILALYEDQATLDSAGQAIRALALYRRARTNVVDFSSNRDEKINETINALQKVAENPPDDVTLSSLYAGACLELEQESRGAGWIQFADSVMDHMVKANPDDAQAYLVRYQYRIASAQIGGFAFRQTDADADLDRALELAPNNVNILLTAGARASNRGDFTEGRKHFETILEVDPSDGRVYLSLGQMHAAQNNVADAIRAWKQGVGAIDQNDPETLMVQMRLVDSLVNGLLATDRADEIAPLLSALRTRVERAYYMTLSQQTDILVSIDFSRALSETALGRYREAVPLLKKAVLAWERSASDAKTAQRLRAIHTLGTCYQRLGQLDLAARMFEEAESTYAQLASLRAANDPDSRRQVQAARQMQAKLLAASADAMVASGRYDKAIRDYERARQLAESAASPERNSILAKRAFAHYQRLVSLPADERNWKAFQDVVLEEARQANPDSLQLKLLEVAARAAWGDESGALELLVDEIEPAHPDVPAVWRAVIVGHEAWGDPADADRRLQHYVARAPSGNVAVMLRASLLSRRRQWKEVRELFLNELEPETESDRIALELQLVQLDQLLGDIKGANQRLSNLVDDYADSLSLVQRQTLVRALAEIALASPDRDSKEVEERIKQLKELEGTDNGTWWRYMEAMRLLSASEEATNLTLRRVERYQSEIEQLRPNWPYGYVLKAEIAVKRDKLDDAIDLLKYAIRMGNRSLGTYRRLTELLFQQGQFAEVDTYLSQLGDGVLHSQGLSNLAMRRSVQQLTVELEPNLDSDALAESGEHIDRAVQLARHNVARAPDDLPARIWLGYTLMIAGESAEAETEFREAIDLDPQSVVARIALFKCYFDSQQRDKALEVARQLETIALPPEKEASRHFAVAQCYEMTGDAQKATAQYRQAVERAPNNVAVLNRAASFLARTDPEAAEQTLRQFIEVAEEKSTPQRRLALHLASRGGKPRWQEALGIVDSLLSQANEGQDGAVNRRLKALILTTRSGPENRADAIRLLQSVVEDPVAAATPTDLLQLASLYEQQGNDELALRQIERLQDRSDLTPEQLAAVVRFYLQKDQFDRAASALEVLQTQAPDSVTTVGLRARYLNSTGQAEQINSLVEEFADRQLGELQDVGLRVELLSKIAALYASVDMPGLAESYFRKAAELDPASSRFLAAWLAKQGQNRKALQFGIARHEIERTPQSIANTLNLLTVGNPTPEDFRLVEKLVAEASERYQDDVTVLTALAMVHYRQQRLDEAVGFFRRVLEIDANNVMALNNLAWTLAEQGADTDQALDYINHAIDYYGPGLQLLDTRGMILLLRQDTSEAVEELQEVVNDRGADPQHQFHLALALQKSGDFDLARKWLETARSGGLSRENLTPFERDLLEDLENALGT